MAKKKREEEKEEDNGTINTPVGRLINHALFVRDLFDDGKKKADKAYYKVELAFEDDDDFEDFENAMLDWAVEEWGEGADDDVILPTLDGDKLAKKREKKDKDGEAYEGLKIIRAKTSFNRMGEDDEGGVAVYNEDLEEVTGLNKSEIYPGCYGQAAVVFGGYQKEVMDEDGDPTEVNAITCYLVAFQKHRDGEKLVQSADKSQLFKKVGKKKKSEGGRKLRKS